MAVLTRSVRVQTKGHAEIRDLTRQVQDVVAESELGGGTATVFVSGSTAGLTTVEYEPGVVQDLGEAFERLAPSDRAYHHSETAGDDNGHAHVRAALLGPSLVVPFADGRLLLGTWQQIVLVDFDTRARTRDIVVQLQGE